MRRVAIVQARMGSTRLPGKVLADLAGAPMLQRQLERLARCERLDEVVLATTAAPADDPVAALAARLGLRAHRGPGADVLARYAGAAREARAELVVRLTADCPLVDPKATDAVVAALETRRSACDYASNVLERHLPRGLDTEALWRDVLERVDRLARSPAAREHVTAFIHAERPDLFALHAVRGPEDAADLRWTVDTPADLAMVRRLFAELGLAEAPRPAAEVIAWVRAHPEVASMNGHVEQKALNDAGERPIQGG
jgi:spore coat polysaccharide biosynthesis protein SpsF